MLRRHLPGRRRWISIWPQDPEILAGITQIEVDRSDAYAAYVRQNDPPADGLVGTYGECRDFVQAPDGL